MSNSASLPGSDQASVPRASALDRVYLTPASDDTWSHPDTRGMRRRGPFYSTMALVCLTALALGVVFMSVAIPLVGWMIALGAWRPFWLTLREMHTELGLRTTVILTMASFALAAFGMWWMLWMIQH